ncbi:hypothetical protein HYE21_00865 [Mycoplasmopsis bovis]|nr:hypothetical protein HYE21_00865 [Mycoplasmopsis bovis]
MQKLVSNTNRKIVSYEIEATTTYFETFSRQVMNVFGYLKVQFLKKPFC